MEGFKPNVKMKSQIACFKEGGSTTPAKKSPKAEMKADLAQDKKIVKKAVSQHEGAKHKGEEKTELKLKQGGRAKKDNPSVKRFDSKAIKMKKDASDKKAIAKVKKTKPVVERMIPAPEAPAPEGMGVPIEDTQDMGMQGYADGRLVDPNMTGMDAFMPPQMPNARPVQRGVAQGSLGDIDRGVDRGMMRPSPMSPMGGQGNISDQERAILQGLQAVGNYCGGGKAY